MSDLVRHSVTQPRTDIVTYVPSVLVGDRPFVEAPAAQNITGALFTKTPTFFTGQLNLNIAGALFSKAPSFFGGSITQPAQDITGALFTKAGTFFAGEISFVAGPDTATLRVLVSAQRW